MKSLEKVVNMIDVRYNMFYIVINILFLWDLQCVISYEKWKLKSDKKIEDWLIVIGWFEALSSLSIVKFDNQDWIYPEIIENEIKIDGKNVGHALLDNKRVCNDVKLTKSSNVVLITGSNMSGKSTYLRTIGITLLMSYYGLPVCAAEFKCSILNIYTCMRISDNLEMNISSFYAELLRIKKIIEALDDKRPLFFLLDEIFKGTNSTDRHIGAKELIIKLSKNNTLGIVSTHDLELGELEKIGDGRISNLHFKEFYENNEIKFDYKINKGVCKTRNAVYLMEMIGLKIKK
jgi:DNA mismatch repair ATPase MutS